MKETRWSQVKRQVFTCFLGRNTWPTSVLPRTWIWWCSVWFCHTACSLCGLQQYEQCMCIMCHVPGFGPFRCDELGHLSVLQIGCLGIPVLKTQTDSNWFKMIQTDSNCHPLLTHYVLNRFHSECSECSERSECSECSAELCWATEGAEPIDFSKRFSSGCKAFEKSWKLKAKS